MTQITDATDATKWVVLDYDGKPLPGVWPTEESAVDDGLCSRYLLSGYEVVATEAGMNS